MEFTSWNSKLANHILELAFLQPFYSWPTLWPERISFLGCGKALLSNLWTKSYGNKTIFAECLHVTIYFVRFYKTKSTYCFSFATIKNWKGFASTGIKSYYQDFREKGPWSSALLHSLNVWYNTEKIQHSCQSEYWTILPYFTHQLWCLCTIVHHWRGRMLRRYTGIRENRERISSDSCC